MSGSYVIRGGQPGRERLRVLSSVLGSSTAELLARVGVASDSRCLDVGCGGGDVTRMMARLAVSGMVVGVDMDSTALDLAREESKAIGLSNVEYREAQVDERLFDGEEGTFDIVYARFLLCHLPEPAEAIARLARLCRPGGVVVVEDTDISGSICWPPNPAFTRCCGLYSDTVRARGGNPDIGQRVPSMLREVGLSEISVSVSQPGALSGDAKTIQLLTLKNIAAAATSLGLTTAEEIDRLRSELTAHIERDDTYITTARIIQTWGRTANR